MTPQKLLVTGFGPFPGVARNLSGWLAQELARSHDAELVAAVLPVCWQGAWAALAPLLDAERPRHVVLFGVSAGARGFCLEQYAYNEVAHTVDALGRHPRAEWLSTRGPAMRKASLPDGEIAAALAGAGLPVETSRDPGRYLCNATLYRTLEWAEQSGAARAGFIHIPSGIAKNSPAGLNLNTTDLLTGARLIVDTVLRADRRETPCA